MAKSPTQRTLEALREDGWHPEVVEKWIPGMNIRKDLWGFVDVLALRDGVVKAVQATSDSNLSSRIHKIADSPLVALVRAAGIQIEAWGWKKGRDGKWKVRVVDLS